MNVYALGASRNIGYHSALRLLAKGATVTYLLRSLEVFRDDAKVQGYVAAGHARLVQGDAMKEEDVARGWAEAAKDAHVDLVLFSVGATPSGFSLTKGALLKPHNICTGSILNVLRTMPASAHTAPPKIVALSSTGATQASHANLPLVWRPLYAWGLAQPHADKLGLERVLARCMGQAWADEEPAEEILPTGWESTGGTPEEGAVRDVVVIRPALLTDGKCKGVYRVGEEREMKGHNGYTVSREDVAHFIAEDVVVNWEKWAGKAVCIAY